MMLRMPPRFPVEGPRWMFRVGVCSAATGAVHGSSGTTVSTGAGPISGFNSCNIGHTLAESEMLADSMGQRNVSAPFATSRNFPNAARILAPRVRQTK